MRVFDLLKAPIQAENAVGDSWRRQIIDMRFIKRTRRYQAAVVNAVT